MLCYRSIKSCCNVKFQFILAFIIVDYSRNSSIRTLFIFDDVRKERYLKYLTSARKTIIITRLSQESIPNKPNEYFPLPSVCPQCFIYDKKLM